MKRIFIISIAGIASHTLMLVIGFILGFYMLPILTAKPSPDSAALASMAQQAEYTGEFLEDLRGHDFLHWGKGTVSLTQTQIVHEGELAPGPDYMLYLVPEFVEHEDEFLPLKERSQRVGAVNSFEGFALTIPDDVNVEDYTTVLIWCEAFSEFITAAKYR